MWHFETYLKQQIDPSHSESDRYPESRMKVNIFGGKKEKGKMVAN